MNIMSFKDSCKPCALEFYKVNKQLHFNLFIGSHRVLNAGNLTVQIIQGYKLMIWLIALFQDNTF